MQRSDHGQGMLRSLEVREVKSMGIDTHALSLVGEVVNLVENFCDLHTRCQKWKPGIV